VVSINIVNTLLELQQQAISLQSRAAMGEDVTSELLEAIASMEIPIEDTFDNSKVLTEGNLPPMSPQDAAEVEAVLGSSGVPVNDDTVGNFRSIPHWKIFRLDALAASTGSQWVEWTEYEANTIPGIGTIDDEPDGTKGGLVGSASEVAVDMNGRTHIKLHTYVTITHMTTDDGTNTNYYFFSFEGHGTTDLPATIGDSDSSSADTGNWDQDNQGANDGLETYWWRTYVNDTDNGGSHTYTVSTFKRKVTIDQYGYIIDIDAESPPKTISWTITDASGP